MNAISTYKPFSLKGSSSQNEEEDFSGGAWAAMKSEMGLDERNPSCFLHSYSVVMVLRKVIFHDHDTISSVTNINAS